MAKREEFSLNKDDQTELEKRIRKRSIPKWEYHRYRILLDLHAGAKYKDISERLQVAHSTIREWKRRYLDLGLAGLEDKPRSGRPKVNDETIEAKVLALAASEPPPGKTHWSTRDISKKLGIPQPSVSVILRRHNLKPHLHRSFMVSNDPDFEEKASKIIGLYMNPPENAIVLCADEKTNIQALDRLQPNLPLKPHLIERSTFEYKRNGVTNLFAAFNTQTGEVTGRNAKRNNRFEFIKFLNKLERKYRGQEIHVILDNLGTHKTKEVKEWLAERPNWHFHFTPTYSSWLNQVEIWFSMLTRQCLQRGVFQSVGQLSSTIMTYIRSYNRKAKPFRWTYSDPSRRIAS